jgi:hypothetical protein
LYEYPSSDFEVGFEMIARDSEARSWRLGVPFVVLLLLPCTARAEALGVLGAARPFAAEGADFLSPRARVWPVVDGLWRIPGDREALSVSPAQRLQASLPIPWRAFALRNPSLYSAMSAIPVAVPPTTWLSFLPNLLLAGAIAGVQFGVDPPRDPRWSARNSFDDGARKVFKGGDRSTRDGAATASDVLLGGLGGALLADWWWLRDEYGALRSLQVDSQWFMASYLTTRVAKVGAGRERPSVRPCEREADYISACGGGRDRNAGFFSGHASGAAVLAGTLCARHLNRSRTGLTDWLVCGGAAATAFTSGVLRMTAERHFMTDVLAGWAVGVVFGYLLPSHFDYGEGAGGPLSLSAISPVVGREYYGVRYGFRF